MEGFTFFSNFSGDWSLRLPTLRRAVQLTHFVNSGATMLAPVPVAAFAPPDPNAPTHMNRAQLQAKINRFADARLAAQAASDAAHRAQVVQAFGRGTGAAIVAGILLFFAKHAYLGSQARFIAPDEGTGFPGAQQFHSETRQEFYDRVALWSEPLPPIDEFSLGLGSMRLDKFDVEITGGVGHRYLYIDMLLHSMKRGRFRSGTKKPTGSEATIVS